MNAEFEKVKLIFTDQIRLSPFNPDKEINILMNAANKSGVGYCFYQYVNDEDKEGEVTIVNANSSALKVNQMQYSANTQEQVEIKHTKLFNTHPG